MRYLLPNFPWSLATFPEIVQNLEFAVGVHRKECSVVVICHELTLGRQPLQRLVLEDALITIQIVENLALEHEVSGTGPRVRLRFLDEVLHLVLGVDVQDSET